jgi:peptidase M23-like protein
MIGTLLYSLKFLLAGAMVIAFLFLVSFLISSTEVGRVQAKDKAYVNSTVMAASNSPNVVTSGMANMVNGSVQAMDVAIYTLNSGIQTAASTTAQVGWAIAHGAQTGTVAAVRGMGNGLAVAGRTVGKGVGFVGNAVGNGALFVLSAPGNAWGFVSDTPVVNSLIRPSDHVDVPIIDPDSAELQTALSALPPTQNAGQAASGSSSGPMWPMRGMITTEFGVAHWPFQRTHTGMDISDGQRSGVTPVKPFRPGRVIDIVHSNRGLGNHVVVDHGNGVTSVYAHLSSISVNVSQEVSLDTVLGLEGSTGASTGTHLHFEIRVNGQAANPRQFISGQP